MVVNDVLFLSQMNIWMFLQSTFSHRHPHM